MAIFVPQYNYMVHLNSGSEKWELGEHLSTITGSQTGRRTAYNLNITSEMLRIADVGNQFFYLIDIYSAEIIYLSPNAENVLGYKSEEITFSFLYDIIHDDDRPDVLEITKAILDYEIAYPSPENLKKFYLDYRVRKASGEYIKIARYNSLYQYDEKEGVYITAGVIQDISHMKLRQGVGFSIVGAHRGTHSYRVENERLSVTRREREIIGLLVVGFSSKDIAGKLHLSIHTVNTHRKNILKKLNLKSVIELIIFASENDLT